MKKESWRDVVGSGGFYQVSDLGRVRSLDRKISSLGRSNKKYLRLIKGKLLSPSLCGAGYLKVYLGKVGGNRYAMVHRLVCDAFLKPLRGGQVTNHKNGIKTDNRLSNLEIITQKENIKHAKESLGVRYLDFDKKGSGNGRAKLSDKSVRKIKKLLKSGYTQKEIGLMFGVSQVQISSINCGNSWAHIS